MKTQSEAKGTVESHAMMSFCSLCLFFACDLDIPQFLVPRDHFLKVHHLLCPLWIFPFLSFPSSDCNARLMESSNCSAISRILLYVSVDIKNLVFITACDNFLQEQGHYPVVSIPQYILIYHGRILPVGI